MIGLGKSLIVDDFETLRKSQMYMWAARVTRGHQLTHQMFHVQDLSEVQFAEIGEYCLFVY